MKIISLNIWGGKIYQPLMKFIKDQAASTDIFCFQEVFQSDSDVLETSGFKTNIFDNIKLILKDFDGYFAKTFTGYDMIKLVNFDLRFGLAMFVKKSISVTSYDQIFIHQVKSGVLKRKDYFDTSRSLQSIQFKSKDKVFNVCNLHGLWIPDYIGKKDSEERIQQSKRIKSFIKKHDGEKIVVGDFNLDPDTKSLKILESHLKNLIKKYSVSTTRSKFYTRQHKFADYTLVSPRVKVVDFQVPKVAISDHLPMILEFV